MEVDYQFQVDYAKSNRANCTKCRMNIQKDSLRMGRLIQERHMIQNGTNQSMDSYHLSCFLRSNICPSDLTTLTGFKKMKLVDREAVLLAHTDASKENRKRPIPSTSITTGAKKAKRENDDATEKDQLRLQSKRLWSIRDKLENEVSKDALIGLLEYNEQYIPTGLSNLLDALSDSMVFGALTCCPSCKNGPLRYSNGHFKCSAMANEWARCLYTTSEPERQPFRVPNQYNDVDFLRTYKYVKSTRLFAADSSPPVAGPLKGYTLFVTEGAYESGKTQRQLMDAFRLLGANVTNKLGKELLVVSSQACLDSLPLKETNRLQSLELRVVSEALLDHLKEKDNLTEAQMTRLLGKHTISDWFAKPLIKKTSSILSTREKNMTNLRDDDIMRCKMKGGAVVDPESGLESRASVLQDSKGTLMSSVLGLVDLVKGSNSFYKLQALKSDSGPSCWVFRAWGRIGTSIGGTKLEKFTTVAAARAAFMEVYLDKTGNEWKERANFQKKPHRFYELELDYGENEECVSKVLQAQKVQSSLHPTLQSLIQFICDVQSMKEAMVEFELDTRKLPLGKLSKRQILEAYSILSRLSSLVDRRSKAAATVDQSVLLGESTHFYTLIPHDFGMKTPPLLDTRKVIKTKIRMLEDLLEMEIAYNILKVDIDGKKNPLDQHYSRLNTDLKPLDPASAEYKRLVDYVHLNHGQTHSHYRLEVDCIIEIDRPDENKRFNSYTVANHNRQLLWHGSRRTNMVGILSQGLRIAPPEAPVTGYMFGKGIYFADMVSKSANYCYATRSQPGAILMLCEVKLGEAEQCLNADASPLPAQFHSRKGVGRITPDPSSHYTNEDGLIYPMGRPTQSSLAKGGSLEYNEYIVYDVSQVKQKYLVRVNFHF